MTTREVFLDGGSPWGFRMHGGADVNQPLRISRVNPGSKASIKGIREGDLITSINGQSTKDITNSEAHSLLKSAGDKLKLGLNEDGTGSPKRRQYNKTVLQETHSSETIKRSSESSSTSYTITTSSCTTTNRQESDDSSPSVEQRTNGIESKGNGGPRENGLASQRSTLSSNESTPSTNSSDTKGAVRSRDIRSEDYDAMADNAIGNSRTKRRRRANRKRSRKNRSAVDSSNAEQPEVPGDEPRGSDAEEEMMTVAVNKHTEVVDTYRVESPQTVIPKSTKPNNGTVVKSRSLDDEEMVRITEVSESECDEKSSECSAIIAEADSDVEWEITEDLTVSETKFSSLSIDLQIPKVEQVSLISPEEEKSLRDFLQSIHLVTSPQRSVVNANKAEVIKAKRRKKREQLAQYFMPVYLNPRYLDAISEENSDLSDREQRDKTIQIEKHNVQMVHSPIVQQDVCLAETMQTSSRAEIVLLEDSSSNDSSQSESQDDTEEDLKETEIKVATRPQLTPPPTPEYDRDGDFANERNCDILIDTDDINNQNVFKSEDTTNQSTGDNFFNENYSTKIEKADITYEAENGDESNINHVVNIQQESEILETITKSNQVPLKVKAIKFNENIIDNSGLTTKINQCDSTSSEKLITDNINTTQENENNGATKLCDERGESITQIDATNDNTNHDFENKVVQQSDRCSSKQLGSEEGEPAQYNIEASRFRDKSEFPTEIESKGCKCTTLNEMSAIKATRYDEDNEDTTRGNIIKTNVEEENVAKTFIETKVNISENVCDTYQCENNLAQDQIRIKNISQMDTFNHDDNNTLDDGLLDKIRQKNIDFKKVANEKSKNYHIKVENAETKETDTLTKHDIKQCLLSESMKKYFGVLSQPEKAQETKQPNPEEIGHYNTPEQTSENKEMKSTNLNVQELTSQQSAHLNVQESKSQQSTDLNIQLSKALKNTEESKSAETTIEHSEQKCVTQLSQGNAANPKKESENYKSKLYTTEEPRNNDIVGDQLSIEILKENIIDTTEETKLEKESEIVYKISKKYEGDLKLKSKRDKNANEPTPAKEEPFFSLIPTTVEELTSHIENKTGTIKKHTTQTQNKKLKKTHKEEIKKHESVLAQAETRQETDISETRNTDEMVTGDKNELSVHINKINNNIEYSNCELSNKMDWIIENKKEKGEDTKVVHHKPITKKSPMSQTDIKNVEHLDKESINITSYEHTDLNDESRESHESSNAEKTQEDTHIRFTHESNKTCKLSNGAIIKIQEDSHKSFKDESIESRKSSKEEIIKIAEDAPKMAKEYIIDVKVEDSKHDTYQNKGASICEKIFKSETSSVNKEFIIDVKKEESRDSTTEINKVITRNEATTIMDGIKTSDELIIDSKIGSEEKMKTIVTTKSKEHEDQASSTKGTEFIIDVKVEGSDTKPDKAFNGKLQKNEGQQAFKEIRTDEKKESKIRETKMYNRTTDVKRRNNKTVINGGSSKEFIIDVQLEENAIKKMTKEDSDKATRKTCHEHLIDVKLEDTNLKSKECKQTKETTLKTQEHFIDIKTVDTNLNATKGTHSGRIANVTPTTSEHLISVTVENDNLDKNNCTIGKSGEHFIHVDVENNVDEKECKIYKDTDVSKSAGHLIDVKIEDTKLRTCTQEQLEENKSKCGKHLTDNKIKGSNLNIQDCTQLTKTEQIRRNNAEIKLSTRREVQSSKIESCSTKKHETHKELKKYIKTDVIRPREDKTNNREFIVDVILEGNNGYDSTGNMCTKGTNQSKAHGKINKSTASGILKTKEKGNEKEFIIPVKLEDDTKQSDDDRQEKKKKVMNKNIIERTNNTAKFHSVKRDQEELKKSESVVSKEFIIQVELEEDCLKQASKKTNSSKYGNMEMENKKDGTNRRGIKSKTENIDSNDVLKISKKEAENLIKVQRQIDELAILAKSNKLQGKNTEGAQFKDVNKIFDKDTQLMAQRNLTQDEILKIVIASEDNKGCRNSEEETITSTEEANKIGNKEDTNETKDLYSCKHSEADVTYMEHDNSFKKEFKELLQEQENVTKMTVSRESSSSSDCSVGTTQCTVKYNPMISSIGDVNSILKDLESMKDVKDNEPETLKEMCVQALMSLPFGADVLEELAAVSQSLEEFTNKLPKTQFHIPPETNSSFTVPVESSTQGMHKSDKWVGLATERDPKTLICLSPTQKEFLEGKRRVPGEADKFLELHEKFVNRRSYHENLGDIREEVVDTSGAGENRLLKIIRNNLGDVNSRSVENLCEIPGGARMKRWNSITLPGPDAKEARLKARGLSEWLQLARGGNLTICENKNSKRVATTNNMTEKRAPVLPPRRRSLPHELFVRQMQYLIEKEKEIQLELEVLEHEKRELRTEMYTAQPVPLRQFEPDDYKISKNGDLAELNERRVRPKSMPVDGDERFRQVMYEEYMDQVAAREERKHKKVIQISIHNEDEIETKPIEHVNNDIEHEFMDKAKKRMDKYGLKYDDSHEKSDHEEENNRVLIMDGDAITEAKKLPKHLQEFVDIAHQNHDGVWSPGQRQAYNPEEPRKEISKEAPKATSREPIPPVWTPRSAGSSPTAERKEFRTVNFESPVLTRKARTKSDGSAHLTQTEPPWKNAHSGGEPAAIEKRLPTSFSAPGPGFSESTSRLPRAQNPTITLLQKAREGQLPKGAAYIEQERARRKNESPFSSSDIVYQVRTESISDSDSERPRKKVISPRKFEGIGPTTKDGMPITLRSEVRDTNMSQWYKKMYETIHKQKPRSEDDEYVMVRYKQRRARYPYTTGYLSEPEPGAYDSDATLSDNKFSTLDRRRPASHKENEYNMSSTLPRSAMSTTTISYRPDVQHTTEVYKNQPGRIENYTPGQSSISDKEAKKWWDEVMEIFDGWLDDHSALPSYNYLLNKAIVRSHLEQQKRVPQTKGYMSQALKESGYESDSTLVFRRRDDTAQQLSPLEQKEVYKNIQKGGDVPLHGLRKLAPERPKDDADIEYFPISPTLNRIRVHKGLRPNREYFCYPISIPPHPQEVFATYKRSAPSTLIAIPRKPPSPPRRKSSRNNSTLRMISNMKIRSDKSASGKRHETCFVPTPINTKTNVKFLRDKISDKLTPPSTRKSVKPSTSSERSKTLTKTPRDTKISSAGSTPILSRRCCNRQQKPCRSCSLSVPRKVERSCSPLKDRPGSADRTFGMAKKSIDLQLPKLHEKRLKAIKAESKKLSESTDTLMKSTTSSRMKTVKPNTIAKPERTRSPSVEPSVKTALRSRSAISPVPSTLSEKTKSSKSTSLDSLKSTKSSTKSLSKPVTVVKQPKIIKPIIPKEKKLKKSKKDQMNVEIVKEAKKTKTKDKKKDTIEVIKRTIAKKSSSNKKQEKITPEELHRQKELVQTDSFFQHLFLRDIPSPTCSISSRNSWIYEKTRALQNRMSAYAEPSTSALEVYLNHTKPVTDSKFKSLDAVIRSRSASPKSVTWQNADQAYYNSERERSISLPPKLIFSQTSRPATPTIERKKIKIPLKTEDTLTKIILTQTSRPISPVIKMRNKPLQACLSPVGSDKLYFSETSRPVSPIIQRRLEPDCHEYMKKKIPDKLFFTETSRPVSPIVDRRSQFIDDISRPSSPVIDRTFRFSPTPSSPKVLRSPSCRKIKSRQNSESRKIPLRAISLEPTPDYHRDTIYYEPNTMMYRSTSSLESCDSKDFNFASKTKRFKELNKFYSDLERLGELERTTSTSDLRPRKRHEDEIIDYDRWKEVRTRERAERELNNLYKQLKENQKEKDFLFRPKDVDSFRWKRDLDRGLRIKDKSVENIKEEFERLKREEEDKREKFKEELVYTRGVYKPLWRGNSVVNLAHMLNERRSQSEGRVASAKQKIIDSEKLLTHGIGSRIWSSLSMEQVNILKNQLTEIYGNDSKFSKPAKNKECTIEVSLDRDCAPKNLRVRRNSDSSKSSPLMERKADAMSEVDKKKISQSLSKEVLERQRQKYKTSLSLVLGKETRGAIAAADAKIQSSEIQSPRTCYSLEMSEDDQRNKENDFVLVLTKDDSAAHKNDINETLEIWAQPKKPLTKTDAISKPISVSETESGSTDGSIKTVICSGGSKEKIQEKVEYFEHIRDRNVYTPTIYKPAETTYDIGDTISVSSPKEGSLKSEKRYLSQSYQNLKDLYGEQDIIKMTTEPLSASRKLNYTPPPSPELRSSRKELYRSRSLSPYYDDRYSSLRLGDVDRLRNRFEHLGDFYSYRYGMKFRRCNSDPQLNRLIHIPGQQNGDVDNLRLKFEYPAKAGRGRSRYRRGGVVSPLCLRAEDRFMPHINIISKIATLYPRKSVSPSPDKIRSSEELANILGIPVGEVEKLRQRFDSPEKMSILGHMFTSSPNINELRDVAQYLTGSWTAHKYPKIEDNARSLSSPEQPIRNGSIVRKKLKIIRPKSTSPVRKAKPSSILKTNKQKLEAVVHKPMARYQPPSPKTSDAKKSKPCRPSTPTHSRPSVTFKEPEGPPPPPPKGHYEITESSPESPRKYVENEVTIHYRTPVRREVKEVLSEDELAKRQADAMRKIYEEERRRKYLQVSHSDNELHDMNSRRHTDNFIPSQKSPIPLNRYDDFLDELSPRLKPRPRSPEPRLVARALYNFVGQTSRELTFKKGDIIYIRRQVDKNWYEGEINAMIGLFPANYVEIVPYDDRVKTTPRKPHEGQARAKYNFIAQTHLELSLAKGELVVVTRRVDDNWFEGKIGGRKGIFPVSYVEMLIDPSDAPPAPTKPVASPAAHSMLLNGSAGGKESMGSHNYVPTFPTQDLGMSYRAKPVQITGGGSNYGSLKKNPMDQTLHIETQSEPIPYRALYKYRPQNEDELELLEGDTVYVLEKCDDGWYVGSSERTGAFGTFPGNYVERI